MITQVLVFTPYPTIRRVQEIAKEIQKTAWPALSESDCASVLLEDTQEDFEEVFPGRLFGGWRPNL